MYYATKIIMRTGIGGNDTEQTPSSPLPYLLQQPAILNEEDNSDRSVDLMNLIRKSMNLNTNMDEPQESSGFHRFVHGAIRAEDLEKRFESPTVIGGSGHHPPPGFIGQPDNQSQPLGIDTIFRGLPPTHLSSVDARTSISSSLHNNTNNVTNDNHLMMASGGIRGTPHKSPNQPSSQQFSVPLHCGLPFDVEQQQRPEQHKLDMAKSNNRIEHLLGPGLILPPPLNVSELSPGGLRFINGAPLLDVQRHLMHNTDSLGSPPGYFLPLQPPRESHKGFFEENCTLGPTSTNPPPQLIHNNHPIETEKII